MHKPRNNIMKLPCAIRWRIFKLLEDGLTYDQVRNDVRVAESCAKHDRLVIHGTTFIAYRNGIEYKEYRSAMIKKIMESED